MDIRGYNREAWNREVERGNPWTIPVSSEEIAAARAGDWRIVLTPTRPVPREWFPPLAGARVLCLACGGGQQGPILAAAGAVVTVLDNSPRQLARDIEVAERDGLDITTIEGDMRDLSCFADGIFDLVVHPISNTFVPDVIPVWHEAYRVLRTGCCLLSGFDNPVIHLFDETAYCRGELVVAHALPYSDTSDLPPEELDRLIDNCEPLEFGHTLEEQIGGQLDAGFVITGFYEDRDPVASGDLLASFTAKYMATRALKP